MDGEPLDMSSLEMGLAELLDEVPAPPDELPPRLGGQDDVVHSD